MWSQWNLLVVEDEVDSADVMARVLRFHHIRHTVTNSAEEALAFVERERPTGLIIDLALPGMDGWALLEHLRANPDTAHIPAVASTAFHSISVANEAMQAGFNAYLPKPIEALHLVEELEKVFTPMA